MDNCNDKENLSVESSGLSTLAKNIASLVSKSPSINWDSVFNATSILSDAISRVVQSSNTVAENLSRILTKLSDNIQQIHLSAYTDEEKQTLIDAFSAWGNYGWTFHPDAPWKFFFTAPSNQSNANALIQPYCKAQNITSLFDKISTEARVHLDDFNIVKELFLSRNYKPCAQMLFSLIDGVYLRIQPSVDEKNQWRKVGKSGINRLKTSLTESEENQWFFQHLLILNLVSCLQTFYKPYNGFKNEPPTVINRNFIMHGMGHRKVLRRDCIQLFLLYYNVLVQTRGIPYRH